MSIFMIIGEIGCKAYATAEYLAQHLADEVPSVEMKSQAFTKDEFEVMLSKMRGVLHCEHTGSPLIWRDLEQIGTCPTYIGGISEFFDFCKEYYGVALVCRNSDLFNIYEKFEKRHMRETLKDAKEKHFQRSLVISIIGAGNPIMNLLLMELIQDQYLCYTHDCFEIRLYEDRKEKLDRIKSMIWDINGIEYIDRYRGKIVVVDNLYDTVTGCNILIVMAEVERGIDETLESWLTNNYNLMKDLALRIDGFGIVSLNTVVTGIQLLCFNTAVLLRHSTVFNSENTIAVTHHFGLEALQYLANVSNISLHDIFCPPVWGFVGLNHVVDTCHTKCLYRTWQINKKPRKNPLKRSRPAVVSFTGQPPVIVEKRDMCFRTHTCELMWRWVANQKNVFKRTFGHFPSMSQVNATIHILNMWINGDNNSELISVGIQSNGSYNIPEGIVFSQPVILRDGKWKIYTELPIPHYTIKLRYLFPLPLTLYKRFNLVDRLPNIEESFLPAKVPDNDEINVVKHQKELHEKRVAMLNRYGLLPEESEEEDEEKRLERKEEIINKLKILRKEMKELHLSNPYSWLHKQLRKMKNQTAEPPEVSSSRSMDRKSVEVTTDEEEGVDEMGEEIGEEGEDEMLDRLFEVTPEELEEALKQFDLASDIGVLYSGRLLAKASESEVNKVKPDKMKRRQPNFDVQYKVLCEVLQLSVGDRNKL